jgi:hypothetical protein
MLHDYRVVLGDPWVRRMLMLVTVEGLLVFGRMAFGCRLPCMTSRACPCGPPD